MLTLSLFWYLLETVVECHYTQISLLPHLDCVLDASDNICRARPPLPSLRYNLLHQKLTLLNCCIEERKNNTHNVDESESDDDDPIYFDENEEPMDPPEDGYAIASANQLSEEKGSSSPDFNASVDPPVKVPLGKGIYNWSGWHLLGSHEPCWIPITKDKDILTVVLLELLHA